MPSIGVYPLSPELLWFLQDNFDFVDNRVLVHSVVMEPFLEIRDLLRDGKTNQYVLRERHRQWIEQLENVVGLWWSYPKWEELQPNTKNPWELDCCMEYWVESETPDWWLFGDGVEIAYELQREIYEDLVNGSGMLTILTRILHTMAEREYQPNYLLLASAEDGWVYVIISPEVANRDRPQRGDHPFEVADAQRPGDTPTYILDEALVDTFADFMASLR